MAAAFITVTIIVIIVIISLLRTSLLFYIFACEITIEVIPWSLISLFLSCQSLIQTSCIAQPRLSRTHCTQLHCIECYQLAITHCPFSYEVNFSGIKLR